MPWQEYFKTQTVWLYSRGKIVDVDPVYAERIDRNNPRGRRNFDPIKAVVPSADSRSDIVGETSRFAYLGQYGKNFTR